MISDRFMNRRLDNSTAEKVDMGLLTRAAFNDGAALRYAELAGLQLDMFVSIMERPANRVRQYHSASMSSKDRRSTPRTSQ
jgi:hypothetical protein